jgi:hypothetical protein
MMNPHTPPKDVTENQERLIPLGRSDCPKCWTTQSRYVFIKSWHRCRTCRSLLDLRLSVAMSCIIFTATVTLYFALISFHVTWKVVSSYPLMSFCFLFMFFYEAMKLAMGRPHIKAESQPIKSQPSVSGRLLLQISASLFLCIATVFVVTSKGTVFPIVVTCVCGIMILMASMILLGRPTAQGYLAFPPSLRQMRTTLIWLVVAVALGVVMGASLLALT